MSNDHAQPPPSPKPSPSELSGVAERLHYVRHEGAGPFALLVHGALGSRSYWADNVAALAQVCRPVVVELWGHGRSPSPTQISAYHPEAYVEQFERIREDLGAEQWVTIGQSMGAALTLRYGLTHPERVLAQVVTNSSSAFSEPHVWRRTQSSTAEPFADQVEQRGTGILADSWVNPGRSRRVSAETRAKLAEEFSEHQALGIANSLRYTNGGLPIGDRLAEVRAPTLLTLGVDEEAFAALVPRARLIPALEVAEMAAAHAVNAQAPGPWNEAAVAFLRRVLAGSAADEGKRP